MVNTARYAQKLTGIAKKLAIIGGWQDRLRCRRRVGESKRAVSEPSDWIVYILECADQTFYTGITNDLDHRIHEHENGRGAKYTRGRAPFTLLYSENHSSRSQALKREIEIKAFDRATKLQLALAV